MKDLAGKTAFVTGAASGIGLGIATALAQAGVKVMLCDIDETALDRAVKGLKQTNADVDGVKADVSLKAELKAAAETTIGRYGKGTPESAAADPTEHGPTLDGSGRSASI
jgi:NAD(P)-dependent dehydrogenase (short-subunit alcohol dehydrogenase family)